MKVSAMVAGFGAKAAVAQLSFSYHAMVDNNARAVTGRVEMQPWCSERGRVLFIDDDRVR